MCRVELFIGKGGVGKSTCSSLQGVFFASLKQKTLLVSMDPAHNLHDIFNCELGNKGKKVTPYLTARETDLKKGTRDYLKHVRRSFSGIYHYQQALNIDKYFDILKFAPGMEEYSAWLALEDLFKATDSHKGFEKIVVDTPPTALTLKTLALGEVNLLWIEQLEQMRMEIIQKKQAVARIRKEELRELADDPVFRQLQTMKKRYRQVQEYLKDSSHTRIHLVMNEDELSFSESLSIRDQLAELSIPIGRVIVNKSSRDDSRWDRICREFPLSQIVDVPLQHKSIQGMARLESLARFCSEHKKNRDPRDPV